mgnify:CR=1 FL=1
MSGAVERKFSSRNTSAPPAQQFDLKGLLRTLQAVRDGDFSVRIRRPDTGGIMGDLTAGFPAAAARALGISDVPLLCAQEIAVRDCEEAMVER